MDAQAARRRDRQQRHPVHRGRARRLRAAGRARARPHAPHRRDHRIGRIATAPPCAARSAVRPAQPHLLRRAPRGRDRGRAQGQPAGGRALHRPRPLQGRQRHARPSDRRRTDPRGDAAAHPYGARQRPCRPHRRRRIRRHHRGRLRSLDAADHREPPDRGDLRALHDQQPDHRDRRQHRHRRDQREDRRRGRHHAPCRHGALSRQERRPQPRLHLRHRDGHRPAQAQAGRKRSALGDRAQRAARRLSADRQQQRRDRGRRRGALPLDASGARRNSPVGIHSDRGELAA